MKQIYIIAVLFIVSLSTLGQTGIIRGTVLDGENGETLPFSSVYIVETQQGASTDFEGAFSLEVPQGTYTLKISFVGMAETEISEIRVEEGEVNNLNIRLKKSSAVLKEVVVTARMVRNSESALLTIQKKSANMMDGVSKQSFRKIGDNDAGAAIKRVTGVSVEGGKYVYVRGLGDRYSKTTLNGLDIPGLDPDRNAVQMDLFPTNLIDNMIVMKSATPNLAGDFTGGVIDIATKDFPISKTFSFSIGTSYNSLMHFRNDFLTYKGSSTDWLGFDNGTRDLKVDAQQKVWTTADRNSGLTEITKRFSPIMGAEENSNLANLSMALSMGNQINFKRSTLGYNVSLNYRNASDFYENAQYNFYIKGLNRETDFEFDLDRSQEGVLSKKTVLASGLAGVAMKWDKHKIAFNALHIQNGENTAGQFENNEFIFNSNQVFRDNLEYSERSITNLSLKGEHNLGSDGNTSLEWILSSTKSKIEDKDIRVTPFRLDDGVFTVEPSEGADPLRLYRSLSETNLSGKVDLEKKFVTQYGQAIVKVGVANNKKQRDYSILQYNVRVLGQSRLDINGNPNALLSPENIWTVEKGFGTYIRGNFEPANTYNATQNIAAAYIMSEMNLNPKWKAIYGVRLERFDHIYSGQSNLGDQVFDKEKINETFDLLPSVNLVYALKENTNLRFSASKTLARPSFKEASISQIFDAISGMTFIGNLDIESTKITNLDARYERFGKNGQMISFSGFYKNFIDPIEVVAYSQLAPNNITPRNVGQATVAGAEMEVRQNIGVEVNQEQPLSLGANFTYVYSNVEMNTAEFESRIENARLIEQVDNMRKLQGQSPYIINVFVNFNSENTGIDANVSYNVQGKRLSVVGLGRNPDIYEMPFNALSFKISKRFGKDRRGSLSVSGENLLNATRRKMYEGFNASPQIYELLKPGSQFGLSVGYSL